MIDKESSGVGKVLRLFAGVAYFGGVVLVALIVMGIIVGGPGGAILIGVGVGTGGTLIWIGIRETRRGKRDLERLRTPRSDASGGGST